MIHVVCNLGAVLSQQCADGRVTGWRRSGDGQTFTNAYFKWDYDFARLSTFFRRNRDQSMRDADASFLVIFKFARRCDTAELCYLQLRCRWEGDELE